VLDAVLGKLARQQDPKVLVGFDKADDAGVYLLAPDLALVQTVDFFTPIVDDPYTFGQIAATNSLSDIYAMGARPINALTMVCFPEKGDLEVLQTILAGGLSKMIEAGCTIIGGHSIRDEEIKFGYAVTGTVHPHRVLTNSGARPGDRLLLTKGLGTGAISTAIKRQKAEPEWVQAAVRSMTTLSRRVAEAITDETAGFKVHGLTDVTGFGLIGHARELALGSHVSLVLYASRIPLLPGALECVRAGLVPGGLKNNREFADCVVAWHEAVAEELRTILFDPQTAGGLLISVAAEDAARLCQTIEAREIGEVIPPASPLIQVEA
jgi:selenide,water dikinase